MDKLYKLFIADWNIIGDRKETAGQFSEGAFFLSAIIFHVILLTFFCIFTSPLFIFLNVFSITLNTVCLLINRKKRLNITMIFSSVEIIFYGVISTCAMGWGSGFQWYLIIAVLPYYLFIGISFKKKIFITLFAVAAFYFIYFYTMTHSVNINNTEYFIIVFINISFVLIAVFMEIKINDIAYIVNNQYIEKLKKDANQDPLTGLWNRRYAESFFEDGSDLGTEYCVALIDIDYFKKINDTYGHDAGDQVLVEFSDFLLKSFRITDAVIRWGGEEILVILNHVGLEKAYSIMDNVRKVAEEKVYLIGGNEIKFTITIGLVKSDADKSPSEIIKESDQCMYFGKGNGRNQVVTTDMVLHKTPSSPPHSTSRAGR